MAYIRKFFRKEKLTSIFIACILLVIAILGLGIIKESPIIKNNKVIYSICGSIYKIAPANAQPAIPCPPDTGDAPCCTVCDAAGGCTTACNPNC